ncbi:unnamed protein product [Arctogadus glacialis]
MLGIKEDRKRPVFKIVSHRSASHLLCIINKHIRQGSSIISDGWRSYRRLHDEDYNHRTVNHREFLLIHLQVNIHKNWSDFGECANPLYGDAEETVHKIC